MRSAALSAIANRTEFGNSATGEGKTLASIIRSLDTDFTLKIRKTKDFIHRKYFLQLRLSYQ